MSLIFQSLIVDERSIQVSYYVEEDRNEQGMMIRTCVMNPLPLSVEVSEVFESLTALVEAWEGLRREPPVPAPHT